MNLQAQWIVGFIDGEGCFHIGISKNKFTTIKYQVLPEFVVTQHKRDIKLLYALKAYFGCGVVRCNKRKGTNVYCYRVRKHDDLINKIIPFFEKHQLKTTKRVCFQKFRKVILLINNKEHLNLEGLAKIKKIRANINKIS